MDGHDLMPGRPQLPHQGQPGRAGTATQQNFIVSPFMSRGVPSHLGRLGHVRGSLPG